MEGQWYGNVQVHREQYQALLAEAEKDRLVQLARAGQRRRIARYDRLLVWLGCRLVTWGQRLQMRFGRGANQPSLSVANEPPCCY